MRRPGGAQGTGRGGSCPIAALVPWRTPCAGRRIVRRRVSDYTVAMVRPEEEDLEQLLAGLGGEQQVLARCVAAGVSLQSLGRLRAGMGHATEFHTVHALARLLGVSVARVDRAVSVRRQRSLRQF